MELEPIIQSEVSQKKKPPIQYTNAYNIEFRKMVTNNPVCETAKETQMYRTIFGSCGRGRGDDLGEWH